MIPIQEAMFHACYTHVLDGKVTMIDAEMLIKDPRYLALPVALVQVTSDHAELILRNSGVEQHRLDRIKHKDFVRYPITLLHWGDGTHTLADGNHHYVAAWIAGRPSIRSRMVEPALWREFEVDIPPAMRDAERMQWALRQGGSGL